MFPIVHSAAAQWTHIYWTDAVFLLRQQTTAHLKNSVYGVIQLYLCWYKATGIEANDTYFWLKLI